MLSFQACICFFRLLNTEEDILKLLVTKQLWFQLYEQNIPWKWMGTKTVWLSVFFKVSSFGIWQKKETHTGVEWWWQNVTFWVNYPFNWKMNLMSLDLFIYVYVLSN